MTFSILIAPVIASMFFHAGQVDIEENRVITVRPKHGEGLFPATSFADIETCREIRRRMPKISILMLTVADTEDDKVYALEAGADDYITKPFAIRELSARVRAAVRRSQYVPEETGAIRIGEIELDPQRRIVRKGAKTIHLTPKEFDLLHHLMSNAGLPITHNRLLKSVWGPGYGNELEYVRTFMRQLRLKIEDDPANPTCLLTDSHVGYRFREPV